MYWYIMAINSLHRLMYVFVIASPYSETSITLIVASLAYGLLKGLHELIYAASVLKTLYRHRNFIWALKLYMYSAKKDCHRQSSLYAHTTFSILYRIMRLYCYLYLLFTSIRNMARCNANRARSKSISSRLL